MRDLRDIVKQWLLNHSVVLKVELTGTKKFVAVCPEGDMFTKNEMTACLISISAYMLILNWSSPALRAIEELVVVAFPCFTIHSFSLIRPGDSTNRRKIELKSFSRMIKEDFSISNHQSSRRIDFKQSVSVWLRYFLRLWCPQENENTVLMHFDEWILILLHLAKCLL